MTANACRVEDCSATGNLTREMCHRHYVRWLKYGDPQFTKRPELEQGPRERLMTLLDSPPLDDSCWTATRGLDRGGYARVTWDGKKRLAHRFAYELLVGPIPDGLDLDHTCRNTACINPAHLEPVTNEENQRRRFALINQCANGHAFDEANTYWRNGRRYCRACNREATRRYKERRRGRTA